MRRLLLLCFIMTAFITGCASESLNDSGELSDNYEDTSAVITETKDTSKTSSVETTLAATQPTTEETTTTTILESTETIPKTPPDDGQLVRILDYIPDAEIDLRYATTNNFTGIVIYDNPEAYLCYGTVKKLIAVQEELKAMGYRILIWDAYRSSEAQWKLWEAYPDPTFVANPNNGITSHSRGNTIDISIVYEDGSPVEMPSEFDEFAAIADRDYSDVSETAAANSRLLEDVMYRNGFTGYRGEWWDYSDTDRYDVKSIVQNKEDSGDSYLTEMLTRSELTYTDISNSSQMILVDSSGYTCNVYLYEKRDGLWNQIRSTSGYVGKNGVTANKVEGDYCTPAGLYSLGFGFGTELVDTAIEYRLINNDCYWVDDTDSMFYNQWVETKEVSWNSAEHLVDYPQSYHYGVVINYNMNPIIPNQGSAIFLHCSTGSYTAGCISIPENDMKDVLQWINSNANPAILIS